MVEVKKVKAITLFSLISEILAQERNTRVTVTGDSMYPFLRDGMDSVEFAEGDFNQLIRGDVVLIQRTDGCYIMHRIIRKDSACFFIVGDAQQWIEGPLYPDQFIAVVTAIWRKNKRIDCSSRWWRGLSELWLKLLPVRRFILGISRKLRKLRCRSAQCN